MGQEQTFWGQAPISALLPKADIRLQFEARTWTKVAEEAETELGSRVRPQRNMHRAIDASWNGQSRQFAAQLL
jgi:hypothetical protein